MEHHGTSLNMTDADHADIFASTGALSAIQDRPHLARGGDLAVQHELIARNVEIRSNWEMLGTDLCRFVYFSMNLMHWVHYLVAVLGFS